MGSDSDGWDGFIIIDAIIFKDEFKAKF